MSTTILGKKLGMTQVFDSSGARVAVTVIEAGPCVIVQKRTPARNKYAAIQIGFQEIPARKANKPERGIFEKASLPPTRYLREVRVKAADLESYKIGDKVTVSIFQDGEMVDIVGTSKGKGFQGVIKRYHFSGFPMTHGTHEYRRHPGSVGMREHPGKVLKGKRMPGHMGARRVTTQNLKLFKVDAEKNLLLISGAVPGAIGDLVVIRKAVKKTGAKVK